MDETFLQELSSALISKLNVTASELLSALGDLSATPVHPYERLKYDYFDTDYQFKTINDIESPKNFCIHTCIATLTSANEQQQLQHAEHYKHLDKLDDCCNIGHAFATHTENGQFVVDEERTKNFIEFHEIVRTIPIESITQENSLEIAHKLLSHYTKIV
jgi:hypothetical protein